MTAAASAPRVDKGETIGERRARQLVTPHRTDQKNTIDATSEMADAAEVCANLSCCSLSRSFAR